MTIQVTERGCPIVLMPQRVYSLYMSNDTTVESYQSRFNTLSDEALIEAFNEDVGKPVWITARANFHQALRNEFDRRGIDDTAIFSNGSYALNKKICLEGKKVVTLKSSMRIMRLNIESTIRFFDEYHAENDGHVSAVVGILGEDLAAGAFVHYLNDNGREGVILNEKPIQGGRGGKWLDRWIHDTTEGILYQTEIKNWSSWAIGGKQLTIRASKEEYSNVLKHYWDHEKKVDFVARGFPNHVTKVLLTMKDPKEVSEVIFVKPLLILWMPISPDTEPRSFFSVDVGEVNPDAKTEFSRLHIFSISNYLRELYAKGITQIDIEISDTPRRLEILQELVN